MSIDSPHLLGPRAALISRIHSFTQTTFQNVNIRGLAVQAGASGYSWAAAHLWRMRALVGGMESEVARWDRRISREVGKDGADR